MEKITNQVIARALKLNEDELLSKANVVGVGIGEKIRGGFSQGRLCLKIYVEKKLIAKKLTKAEFIPQEISRIETDVEEAGKIIAQSNTGRFRPAPGGVSLGHYQITAGTLGCLVKDKKSGKVLILSNNHVLANSNKAEKGDPILQPGPYDGGKKPKDLIGYLENWIEINFKKEANLVDAALARPKVSGDVRPEIMLIGSPQGLTKAKIGMPIQKSGRTTGYTTGKVKDISASVKVNYDNQTALFRGQILTTNMSQGGDSGSLVLDMKARAVGLLFAGSEQVTILNPINEVLRLLDVEILS
ncbi:MAG: hypothetical protein A2471_03795 [Omnitrophica WOR_2 bacterium RIFOXYC2_FULL_45_15]|nr:MAG: hypothetical protein A2471_03795 [Omnitrophica WOR_2 bacterium RIFOXYC2_FULL_45_15]